MKSSVCLLFVGRTIVTAKSVHNALLLRRVIQSPILHRPQNIEANPSQASRLCYVTVSLAIKPKRHESAVGPKELAMTSQRMQLEPRCIRAVP